MGWGEVRPETLEERLIYWAIVGTWGLWLLGALYIVGPVLAYALLAIIAARALGVLDDQPVRWAGLSTGVVLWIVGMLAMEVALVVAHLDFEIGFAAMLKSSIGWMKGWALMAVFIVAGALMRIRAMLVYRACGLLAAQTLALAPLFFLASAVGLPSHLYVSPLQIVGGPGPEFFDVTLYATGDVSGLVRWRFFAPWATAAAFLAGIWFIFALYERSWSLKLIAIASAVVVCAMAGSRTSVVALPGTLAAVLVISNVRRPEVILALAVVATGAVLLTDQLLAMYEDMVSAFNSARAASSRVRSTLANIAYHRWWTEAILFGHGTVERGPHLVEFMKIGSHHTWHGLLFVKGAVGFAGLALPLAWSVLAMSLKAQRDRVARAGLGVLIAVVMFSFGDNLEIVAYLVWPGLIMVGIAHGRRLRNPFGAIGRPCGVGTDQSSMSARWT